MAGALEAVGDWPVRTAAVAVVAPDGVVDSVGPTGLSLAWASVTKPLTAVAVLVTVARGALELDEPAGPSGSTVRHLLAHASGLPPREGAPGSAPGRRRIYSGVGFERLAEHVTVRTGRAFPDIVRQEVLLPLGMHDTRLAGSAAAGARGSLDDLVLLARELLAPTLIGRDLHAEATTPAFPELEGVLPGFGRFDPNPWGLGVEIRGGKQPHWSGTHNSPRTFGHFGQSGALLWVDPDVELACALLTDRPFGPWARRAWPALADGVLDAWG